MTRLQQIGSGALCVLAGFFIGNEVGRSSGAHLLADMSHSFTELVGELQKDEPIQRATFVKLQLAEIEAVQRGDNAKFLQIACKWMRLNSSHLAPADWPERADEVRELLERSQAKLAEFEKAGERCGDVAPSPPPREGTAASTYSR